MRRHLLHVYGLTAVAGVLLAGAPWLADARAAPTSATRSAAARAATGARVLELDWRELLPQSERSHFTAVAPPPLHDSRGEGGPPALQTLDFSVNKALNGTVVRLPGFIVPLEPVRNGRPREFLLVPYFGSCIHVPPPPPNQIVYVLVEPGAAIDSIYDAYWITGKLRVQNRTTRLGATAYELSADKIEVYRY